MRLIVPHLSSWGPHADDEVIDLTDRLAPYESSVWRAPQQESPVEPNAPAPSSLGDGWRPGPWQPDPAPRHRTTQGEPTEAEAQPAEPILEEPVTPDTIDAAVPPVDEVPETLDEVPETLDDVPETLDLVLAKLVEEEAEALEAAMHPVVAERGLGPAAPRQPRNERCACGSGRKYKRCCGERRDVP